MLYPECFDYREIQPSSVVKGCIEFSFLTLGYFLLLAAFLERGEGEGRAESGSVSCRLRHVKGRTEAVGYILQETRFDFLVPS